jgi:hypothetical protein
MVDVHRREAALVVMGIPERKLLTACAFQAIVITDSRGS